MEKGKDIKHLFYLVSKTFSLVGARLAVISIVSIILFSAQNFFANYLIARCMSNLLNVLLYGGEIWAPLVSFIIYFIIFNITLAMGFWGLQYVSAYGGKQIRLEVFQKSLTVSADDANLRDSSQLQARLEDDVNGAVTLAGFGPASWLMPYVAGVGSLVVICTIQPLLLIPVIVIACAELFANFKFAPKMRELSEDTINQKAGVGEEFANDCRGTESIRNFSVKDPAIKSFSKACMELMHSNLRLTIFSSKLGILSTIAGWVCFTGTLIFGLFLTKWFEISLPDLMLTSNIACLVKMMLSGIGDSWTGIQSVMDCSQYNRFSRTSHIHYILQETELFDASIEENILLGFGDPKKGRREDTINAAKLAEIHDFILTLPNGYATEVGEGGKNLSGGQRQRILIARALVNNVKLLLLDEPTSALDVTTEAAIIKTIRKIADAGVAVVMVTHREQLTQYADKLYRVC